MPQNDTSGSFQKSSVFSFEDGFGHLAALAVDGHWFVRSWNHSRLEKGCEPCWRGLNSMLVCFAVSRLW